MSSKEVPTEEERLDLYVQYGCGMSAPQGWRNYDASPTLRFERLPFVGQYYSKNETRFPANVEYGNIVKGLPVQGGSCAGVYCSHVLEHLSLADFRVALKNTNRILKPGGIFRLVVPDLEFYAKKYLEDTSCDAAHSFMKETYLGHERRAAHLKEFIISWFGNHHHLWMWDYKSLQNELKSAGFVSIRRARYGDSKQRMFDLVEEEGRWVNSLGVECLKPHKYQ